MSTRKSILTKRKVIIVLISAKTAAKKKTKFLFKNLQNSHAQKQNAVESKKLGINTISATIIPSTEKQVKSIIKYVVANSHFKKRIGQVKYLHFVK